MDSSLPLVRFPFDGDAVTAAVTTRHGGVSTGAFDSLNLGGHVGDDPAAVAENRRRLAAALGVDAVTFADQRHTDTVAVVDAPLAGLGRVGEAPGFPATDALITNLPGVALAMMVADCAPVVLYDPVRRAVGVVHSGRVGTVKGIVPAAVAALGTSFGCEPGNLLVGIGPAIGPDSYEIGAAEASSVMDAFGDQGTQLLLPSRPGHALFNLPKAIHGQLLAAGVAASRIHDLAVDTRQHTDTFFSDRAQRPCGRFAAVAMLAG